MGGLRYVSLALSVAVALVGSMFSAPVTVRAEHTSDHYPSAKIQLVLKDIHVIDDEDWFGKGEINIFAAIHRCKSPVPQGDAPCTVAQRLAYAHASFSASSGATVTLNAIAATPSHRANEYDDEDASLAVYSDETYVLSIVGVDDDTALPGPGLADEDWDAWSLPLELGPDGKGTTKGDYMGMATMLLDEGNDYGAGQHSLLGSKDFGADFSVDFEIRKLTLPDLVPYHAILRKLDDGREVLCVSALNRGEVAAGAFPLTVWPADIVTNQISTTVPVLAVAGVFERCILITELGLADPLQPGTHEFSMIVNQGPFTGEHAVPEIHFGNNYLTEKIIIAGPAVGEAPSSAGLTGGESAPTSGRADLTVSAIRVRGKDPSGQNDCDPGKNDIAVTVKNQGTVAAAAFPVRVVVDEEDDEAQERTFPTLDAGKQQEIIFEDVSLKKGQHRITAVADAKKSLAEASEDNNEMKVTVSCRDE